MYQYQNNYTIKMALQWKQETEAKWWINYSTFTTNILDDPCLKADLVLGNPVKQ